MSEKRILTTEVKQLNAVTILQDIVPPTIRQTFPRQNVRYDYQDVETITVKVNDDLSGISPDEQSIALILNEQKVFAAYQPIKKEISYRLNDPLKKGDHQFTTMVKDRAGNTTRKTINFAIN